MKQTHTNLHKMLSWKWPYEKYKNVTWLNESQDNWELALVILTYGNETSMCYSYSHAVLIIEITARSKDMNKKGSSKTSGFDDLAATGK